MPAWWISGQNRPASSQENPFYYNLNTSDGTSPPTTFLGRLQSHPVWMALSADIFMGQIIASLIVLTFVAVFLLREWISQNARPGVFEDEEILDDPPIRDEFPAPAARQGGQPHLREINPLDEALARRQIEALRALDALRARDGVNGHMVGEDRAHGRSPIDLPRKKGKGRKGRYDADQRASTRRKLYPEALADDDEHERLRRKAFSRRVFAARMTGARRKAALAAIGGAPEGSSLPVDPKFEFTFTTDKEDTKETTPDAGTSEKATADPDNLWPTVTLEPFKATIPFSFDNLSPPSPPAHPEDVETDASSTSSNPRRPPLLPSLGTPVSSRVTSPVQTPVENPSIATYCAPEEFEPEAGPSRLPESVPEIEEEKDSDEEESTQQEFDAYFQDRALDVPILEVLTDEETDNEAEEGLWRLQEPNVSENDEEEEEDEEAEEEAAAEMEDFVFDEWEAVEEGEAPDRPPLEGPEAGVVRPGEEGPAEAQAVGGAIPAGLAEELEANGEDDMEGAMEAIGMRGPIYGVLQNAALMIFVLDTAIGLGVWVPFTVGKSFALLTLDPPRFLQIIHLPIRAIRVMTDPIVDGVAFFLTEIAFPPFKRAVFSLSNHVGNAALYIIGKSLGQKAADSIVFATIKLGSNVASLTDTSLEHLYAWSSSTSTPQPQASAVAPSLVSISLDKIADLAEPQFAWLGVRVRYVAAVMKLTWVQFAIGESPADRVFAIVLGYAVVLLGVAIYLNLLTVGNARTAGRAVRSAVRQQLLVLKVAAFIFIELVTFPLCCGVVLDLCTVWLFSEANFASRAAFFVQAPLTATFYHWVAGTMFMYAFAVLLSGCRAVMRSGAMWFIKDPQDQNAHPIRDILDRPTLTQLRKICVSGVLYSCVVACAVGSVAGLLLLGNKSIMPIRWKNRAPLSNVPIDLLFLHLVLPYTMHYFRPKRALRDFATVIWKALAHQLRLTSYFFGGRHPAEERSNRWNVFSFSKPSEESTIADGTLRRVPATDNMALPRDMRATVGVTETGEPVDEEARILMEEQNAEMDKAKRSIADDFEIVYIPPLFRYRIFLFIALLWVIGAILLGLVVALPILIGRRVFELFTPRDIHDGYSLIVGFYLLWGFFLVGSAIDRLDRQQRRDRILSGERARADLPVLVMKRGLLWVAKSGYMALCLGVVIPTLISFVIDLYIILPIRFTLDPGMTPRIRVVDTWALGLLYVKIALHATRIQPPNRISRGIQHILNNGWTRSDPVQATREVIGPVVGGLLGMIIFPGAVFRAMQYFLPHMPLDDKFICKELTISSLDSYYSRLAVMHIYPGIFMLAGLVRSSIVLYGMLASWSQSIRDKEFLVEMRLRNHEPEKETETKVETRVLLDTRDVQVRVEGLEARVDGLEAQVGMGAVDT
ncbi:hypothetical protein DXG03_008621 [Asterophora parasitica]|uniref:RING-type E3 ubiquitin transferase n=1 Tax=Asterophora parasitica TaxID=117018 RepID=A0A9P7G435_9AGAR|nr:hypothetical protein DXG03_008621 [Asterophora parasitica]